MLRREPHLADVPIMMVTGLADPGLRLDALEHGANDVLTRPVEPDEDAWPAGLAWAFILRQVGTYFDPDCVAAFEAGESEVREIPAAYPDRHRDPPPRRYW